MIRAALFALICELAVLSGTAAVLLHRHRLFADFRAGSPRLRRIVARSSQPPAARVEVADRQPPVQPKRPTLDGPVAGTFSAPLPEVTAPAVSDIGLTGRCVCGAWALRVHSLLSDRRTCTACCRTLCVVGSQHAFVPVRTLRSMPRESEVLS